MGFTITIGNAIPQVPTQSEIDEGEDRTPRWRVQRGESEDAPSFPGDIEGSVRRPSYQVWGEFCQATDLSSLFFGAQGQKNITPRDTCLILDHPGVTLLAASDLVEVRHALELWRAKPWPTKNRIAGFDPNISAFDDQVPDPQYDGHLCRLLWLEFWIDWALKNCEFPAIGNT